MLRPQVNSAYVLWVIRERIATTWYELYDHFDAPGVLDSSSMRTSFLIRSLRTLLQAKLIQVNADDAEFWADIHDNQNFNISVTAHEHDVLNALDVRLSELAKSDPSRRVIADPIFERATGKYQSDILVFTPFAESLRPVYDDHLKSVAKKLGQQIKRADDFFTNQKIVSEIWTALLDTKAVIADCTGRNPNVFYELGIAHTVGKPAVLITQSSDDIPFDLYHLRHIRYEMTPRGMAAFENELEQTLRYVLRNF